MAGHFYIFKKLTNMFNIKIYFDIFIKILIIDPIHRFGSVSLFDIKKFP